MKSWDTMKKTVNGKTGLMSSACIEDGWTLEPPTLYKYQEQYGGTFSGAPNCIDRTNRIINASKKIGNPYEAWSAALHYLCQEHGHLAIKLPEKNMTFKDAQLGLMRCIKESSDLTQASAASFESGDVDLDEADKIIAEGEESARQTLAYVEQIKQLHNVLLLKRKR